ncbi:MAG: aromatic aminobenezylarsenical efflux permease ArsG family transporter [Acidobacteriota bacterium]|jgi:cytochrome c biogenesis protein CcdA|nr:aromatic aminobenezylarsenical efflux permease ArsG family transporter [Acidobacteriota bacterium]
MQSYYFDIFSALWLGILTSISPCPLATNIAAVSFISRNLGSSKKVLWSGLLYAAGRMLAYVAIAVLAVGSLLSLPEVSFFLESNMHKIIGPLLIAVGLILLEVLPFSFSTSLASNSVQEKAGKWGLWGSGLLGIIFALTFCPLSAALFFGSLIPLAVDGKSAVMMPSVYGLGTAIPVIAFAFVMVFSVKSIGKIFNKLTQIEKWVRRLTAILFIGVGLYLLLKNMLGF